MKGTRPLNNNEILLVSACFDGTFEVRNRALFMIDVSARDSSKNGLPHFRKTDTLNKSSLGWHCYETVTQHGSLPPSRYSKWITDWKLEKPR